MLKTAVCDLFSIRYPIIQGGMAHVGTAELVSAVSDSGGLGIIGAGFYEPSWVQNQIQRTKQKTSNHFGLNIQLASPYVAEIIELAIDEKVPVVTTGAGNPEKFLDKFKQNGIIVSPVINSVEMARRLEKAGADAVIAEGMESGGHIGETTTMVLVPQVADAVNIPVIAAGGIADGRGLAAALSLGAQGVQMGTRFVCSTECIAADSYKRKILEADDRATVVTRKILGMPQRSISNSLTEQFQTLESAGASREELEMFDRNRMYLGLIEGNVGDGSLLAGQIAGMIKEIKPVKEIIEEIMMQAEIVINALKMMLKEK